MNHVNHGWECRLEGRVLPPSQSSLGLTWLISGLGLEEVGSELQSWDWQGEEQGGRDMTENMLRGGQCNTEVMSSSLLQI